jgi:hypothetical protein
MLKRFSLHPFLFAAYPVLALLATNLGEVWPAVAVRPLVLSLAGCAVLYLVGWLVHRHAARAALVASLALLLFFSYGHLAQTLTGEAGLLANPTPALLLGFVFILLLGVGVWLVWKKVRAFDRITGFLNLVGIVLVAFPLYRIVSWSAGPGLPNTAAAQSGSAAPLPLEASLQPPQGELPDVYFIVLDTYTRADALQEVFGYDNSPFLDSLRELGFFVADCSHSNYDYTMQSLSSTLNMDFLTSLQEQLGVPRLNEPIFGQIIHHSRVRLYLESLGYQTVAFETGFGWSELTDASIYLGPSQESYLEQSVGPFEAMLVKSTALLPLFEMRSIKTNPIVMDVNFPFSDHIRRQLSLLDQLAQVSDSPEPTFAFVHILIPHIPFVFGPDGTIHTDPGYYGGPKNGPVDETYRVRGYTGQVQFINSRILPIVQEILAQPGPPPIIILQGDHGFTSSNRYKNLSTYYVNEKAHQMLYPTISPINSFRVVFNAHFGTEFPLLPDEAYTSKDITRIVSEEAYRCE